MSTLAATLDTVTDLTVLGPTATWVVLATLALAAVSYGLADFTTRFGGRTALNCFVCLFALDGVGAMLLLAAGITTPFAHVASLIAAQALLVVLPFVIGGVLLDLAPGSAVVGAIPIGILVGFLATFDLGLVSFAPAVRVTVAAGLAIVGPTIISAASWQGRNLLD